MLKKRFNFKLPGIFRFIICSLLGIFVFFVQIPINGQSRIPVDHIIALIKGLVQNYYAVLILFFIVCSVAMRFWGKEKLRGMDIFYLVQSLIAFVFVALGVFGLLPEKLHAVMTTALSATGNILCAILMTSFFVPLLVEYGLVDFVGVFVRPFMRKVFLTPGSSAIIGVSAFLGNYSMGHVLSRKMYEEGEFTEKESVIVSLGFSTCSIGLMINLANYMDIMPHWSLYVISILVVTFLTTLIVARIPPISKKKNEYAPGIEGVGEESSPKTKLLRTALDRGVEKATSAPPFARSLADILKRVMPVICEITGTSMFIIVAALLLLEYTGLFSWIGFLFFPILWLCGFDMAEIKLLTTPLGACLFEPVLSGVVCDGVALSATAKWVATVVPYASIVFLAGFFPSLWKNRIHCSIWEALIIWVERMIIGIIITVIIAKILIALGMI